MNIVVYSDGSGTTGNLPGGWGFVVIIDGIKTYEGSGHIPKATNNVAEVTAAIRGLEYVDQNTAASKPDGTLREVILRSDSQLVLGYGSGRYRCKAMHLLPLCLQLRKLFNKLEVKDEWVRGHSGDINNERCDQLAKAARESTSGQDSDDKIAERPN